MEGPSGPKDDRALVLEKAMLHFKRGKKEDGCSPKSMAYQTKLSDGLVNFNASLSLERHVSMRGLIVGSWMPERRLCKVEVLKGNKAVTMGFNEGSSLFFWPEEALYLVEQGSLELKLFDLPLSLQQCYALLGTSLSLREYVAYAHLCRLGYIVRRSEEAGIADAALVSPAADFADDCPVETVEAPPISPWDGTGAHLSQLLAGVPPLRSSDSCAPSPSERAGGDVLPMRSCLRIAFDVWKPSQKMRWKKSNPGPPHFRVCVCDFSAPPPDLEEQRYLDGPSSTQVPVRFAVVHSGTVTFSSFKGSTPRPEMAPISGCAEKKPPAKRRKRKGKRTVTAADS